MPRLERGFDIFHTGTCQKSADGYIEGMRQASVSPVIGPQSARDRAGRDTRASDAAVIELLRLRESLEIGELASSLKVTATAVRQRLDRLMKAGLV